VSDFYMIFKSVFFVPQYVKMTASSSQGYSLFTWWSWLDERSSRTCQAFIKLVQVHRLQQHNSSSSIHIKLDECLLKQLDECL